jgi:hypothetical protein
MPFHGCILLKFDVGDFHRKCSGSSIFRVSRKSFYIFCWHFIWEREFWFSALLIHNRAWVTWCHKLISPCVPYTVKIRFGWLLLTCISLFPFVSKLNIIQRMPLVILCFTLRTTPFAALFILITLFPQWKRHDCQPCHTERFKIPHLQMISCSCWVKIQLPTP